MSRHRKNSVRDNVIAKKWIFLERNALQRQSLGHLRGRLWQPQNVVWLVCKTQNSGFCSKEEKPRDPINEPSRCNAQEGLLSAA